MRAASECEKPQTRHSVTAARYSSGGWAGTARTGATSETRRMKPDAAVIFIVCLRVNASGVLTYVAADG